MVVSENQKRNYHGVHEVHTRGLFVLLCPWTLSAVGTLCPHLTGTSPLPDLSQVHDVSEMYMRTSASSLNSEIHQNVFIVRIHGHLATKRCRQSRYNNPLIIQQLLYFDLQAPRLAWTELPFVGLSMSIWDLLLFEPVFDV